jgi:hypothetical protein
MRWIPVSERMPAAAQDDGDVLYCRVVYEDAKRPTDRRVGYFDGGEWKDVSGYKFATYGGTVTHWFEPPEIDTAESIGMQIEGWVCYGMPAQPLTPQQRTEIREFAEGFEECSASHDELVDKADHDLIRAAYRAMAEYARGQM